MKVSRNYDYYEDEKLYSTGDYELDELLERAFCEGYYYAQKEYFKPSQAIKQGVVKLKRNQVAANIRKTRGQDTKEARKLITGYKNNPAVKSNLTTSRKEAKESLSKLIQDTQKELPKSGGNLSIKEIMDKKTQTPAMRKFKSVIRNYKTAGTSYNVGM